MSDMCDAPISVIGVEHESCDTSYDGTSTRLLHARHGSVRTQGDGDLSQPMTGMSFFIFAILHVVVKMLSAHESPKN